MQCIVPPSERADDYKPHGADAPSQSLALWSSVSTILKEGVGVSILPCAKLRAIIEVARDISRLYSSEHDDVAGDAVHSSAERAS
jgi:hypothetical protein